MRDDDQWPTDAYKGVAGNDEDGETLRDVANDRLDRGVDVGGYVIDGVLGQGAMGTVYSATHPMIGKRAAIKVLRPELSKTPAAVERFVLEARAVNQIGHPNIVDIFAFGALRDGRSYYVMDLLVGETLRARVKRTGPKRSPTPGPATCSVRPRTCRPSRRVEKASIIEPTSTRSARCCSSWCAGRWCSPRPTSPT